MTTSVEVARLLAEAGPKVTLAGPQQVISSGTGNAFSGFSALTTLFVEAAVQIERAVNGRPSLTLLIEHSDDGNSWSTAATFTFGADGTQTTTISSPKNYVRASWSVGNRSEWYLRSVVAGLSVPGGGGSSLPAATMGRLLYSTDGSSGLGWTSPVQVCDVKLEFGAAFNGSTDDTLAIKNALASGAGIIQFPPGVAKITSLGTYGTLTVPDGVTVQGAGPGITGLNFTNLTGYSGAFLTVNGAGSIVRDFAVMCDSTATTHANDAVIIEDDYPTWGSYTGGGTFATIERLLAWNIAGNAFTLNGLEARAINCYAVAHALSGGDGGYGFYTPQTDTFLIGCTADHCGKSGFNLDGANTKVIGCKAFGNGGGASGAGNGHGFEVSGVRHMLSGCEAQDNQGSGFMCLAGGVNISFAGCFADTNGQGGVNTAGFNLYGTSSAAGCGAMNRSGTPQQYGFYGRADGGGNLPTAAGCSSSTPGTSHVGGSWAYCQVGMPTTDPHVVGQAWANSHIVTVSSG